eukprot:2484803-Prymnesium_polylepis.1
MMGSVAERREEAAMGMVAARLEAAAMGVARLVVRRAAMAAGTVKEEVEAAWVTVVKASQAAGATAGATATAATRAAERARVVVEVAGQRRRRMAVAWKVLAREGVRLARG